VDELDGLAYGLCIAALAIGFILLTRIIRDMQTDIELIRVATPVATGKDD